MNIGKTSVIDVDLKADALKGIEPNHDLSSSKFQTPGRQKLLDISGEMPAEQTAGSIARRNLNRLILRQAINRGVRMEADELNPKWAQGVKK